MSLDQRSWRAAERPSSVGLPEAAAVVSSSVGALEDRAPGGEVLSLSKDTIGLSSLARHCSPEPEAPPRLGGFAGPSAIPRRTGLRVV